MKKDRIINSGIQFINCAELHHDKNNVELVKADLTNFYRFKDGYVSPFDSRHYTYDLIEMAVAENWHIGVHDCSNATKLYRGIQWNDPPGTIIYGKEFLPIEWYLATFEKNKDYFEKFLDEKEVKDD